MTLAEKAIAALESASTVLCLEDWWCTGSEARSEDHYLVDYYHKGATSFCAIGAVMAAADSMPTTISQLATEACSDVLNKRGEFVSLTTFNDDVARSNLDVAELLWEAAQLLREEHGP